jgi:hypothetical protein
VCADLGSLAAAGQLGHRLKQEIGSLLPVLAPAGTRYRL